MASFKITLLVHRPLNETVGDELRRADARKLSGHLLSSAEVQRQISWQTA